MGVLAGSPLQPVQLLLLTLIFQLFSVTTPNGPCPFSSMS